MMIKIPKKFTIHCHEITVNIVPELEDGNYGEYNNIIEEIRIAENMREGSKLIPLSETQKLATFLHELIHCMEWHCGKPYDEQEAQSYSGMLLEFLNTSIE